DNASAAGWNHSAAGWETNDSLESACPGLHADAGGCVPSDNNPANAGATGHPVHACRARVAACRESAPPCLASADVRCRSSAAVCLVSSTTMPDRCWQPQALPNSTTALRDPSASTAAPRTPETLAPAALAPARPACYPTPPMQSRNGCDRPGSKAARPSDATTSVP